MARSSVGIYISAKYIDIVELSGSKTSPAILNFVRQEIPPMSLISKNDLDENRKQKQDRVSIAIKEAIDRLNIKSQYIHTVLSSDDVMIRYFDMPILPKAEQSQAIRFEARKYVPFKLDQIKSDFKIILSSKGRKSMDVFFIAATKDRLSTHIGTFNSAELQVSSIDIVPFVLLRAIMLEKKLDIRESIAIVHADNNYENISIHIIESGMPFMSRDVKITADDKDSFFERMASEIRVSIDYYCGQKPKHSVSRIIFCGEALFQGIDVYISDELKIITETLYGFTKIKNINQAPSSAVIAIGTALAGLGKFHYSIDLSPAGHAMEKRRVLDVLSLIVVLAVAVISLTFLLSNSVVKNSASEFDLIKQKSLTFSESTSLLDMDQLTIKKQEEIEHLNVLRLVKHKALLANKLSAIAKHATNNEILPRALWLDNINFKESFILSSSKYPSDILRELSIAGNIFSPGMSIETDYINKFFELLQKDMDFMNYFQNIELGPIQRHTVEDNWVSSFTIVAFSHRISEPTRGRSNR